MRQAAFSLIELLVVIAIIATLSALLMPVLASSRERGRRTHCVSGMRIVGQAIQMYLNDHDELFPSDRLVRFNGNPMEVNAQDQDLGNQQGEMENPFEDEAVLTQWYERVRPYTRVNSILLCPNDVGRKVALGIPGGDVREFERPTSFGINRWFEFDTAHMKTPARPADTILLGEVVGRKRTLIWPFARQYTYQVLEVDIPWWQWVGVTYWPLPANSMPMAQARRDLAHDRHGGGSHYLYLDGHVKWARFAQVWGNGLSTNQFWPTRP